MKIASLLLASALLVSGSAMTLDAPQAPAPPAAPAPPGGGGGDKGEHRPHMRIAIHELEATIKQLQEAKHDFGGHREAAIKACQAALEQLREAVKFAEEHPPKGGGEHPTRRSGRQ